MDKGESATHLDTERHGRHQRAAKVGPLERGEHSVSTGLSRDLHRVVDVLREDGVLVVPVVSRDVADKPASGPLRLVVLALLVEPDGRLGKEHQDWQPQPEEHELRVKRRAECHWRVLCVRMIQSWVGQQRVLSTRLITIFCIVNSRG